MSYRSEYAKIVDFINKSLLIRLTNDQKNLKIVSEGDLQSCVYYHLRRFFKKEHLTKWHILNKLSMEGKKTTKQFPDIVISWMTEKKPKGSYPDILIELKETANFKERTASTEIKKLVRMMNAYNSSGVFLYACLDKRAGKKVKQTDKIMEDMIPEDWKKFLNARTINIQGKKTYSADMDYFDEKVEILRMYRG